MPATSISELPAELLIRITDRLEFHAVKLLSEVNSQFHEFLVPTLFKTLRADNRAIVADKINEVVSKYGRHVETLYFICFLEPNDEEETEKKDSDDEQSRREGSDLGLDTAEDVVDDGDVAGAGIEETEEIDHPSGDSDQPGFSQVAQELLAGTRLPCLKAVMIKFQPLEDFNTGGGDWGGAGDIGNGDSIYIHERLETVQERIEDEADYHWRAYLNKTFRCLSSNTLIKKLVIHDFLPKPCSTFYEPEWPAFLARLTEFEIHLWGGENGACWHSSTLPGYTEFIACLPELIFQHLCSTRTLDFVSEARNAVGCEGMNHASIPLQPASLPEIRHLTIRNCYIDPALQSFIESKAQQLESLRILDCYSAATQYTLADNGITWAQLFRAICKSKPILASFEFSNEEIQLMKQSPDEAQSGVVDVGAQIREDVEKSGGKIKLFGYADASDKYGDLFQDQEANMERYRVGEDQREYDVLMDIVAKNQEKHRISMKPA